MISPGFRLLLVRPVHLEQQFLLALVDTLQPAAISTLLRRFPALAYLGHEGLHGSIAGYVPNPQDIVEPALLLYVRELFVFGVGPGSYRVIFEVVGLAVHYLHVMIIIIVSIRVG